MADLNNQKKLGGPNNMQEDEAVDRITALPDPLIHHILSFLAIKDVARTCILSERWNKIWSSVPNLDFLSLSKGSTDKFMDIVDNVLHLHDMTSIQRFSICHEFWRQCDCPGNSLGKSRASRINLWIYGAIKRKVKEIKITLKDLQADTFCPASLFTCQSLTTLEINVFSYCDFYVPKHISIPKLKNLKLGGVKFNKKYNNVLLSLLNCPELEDLTLENCIWVGVKSFCISSPSVEHLKIINKEKNSSGRADNRGQKLGLRDSGLKIDAPKLVSLIYNDGIPKDFVMSSSLTLTEADVDVVFFDGKYQLTKKQNISIGAAAVRFLQVLSHVKVLSIGDQLVEDLSIADDVIKDLPTFNNLKQLNVSAEDTSAKVLVALLRSAPNLESLVIKEFCCDGDEDYNYGELDFMTAGCSFSQLKSVCFEKFAGEHLEMWSVKLFLGKSKALQTMKISHSFPHYLHRDGEAKSEEEVKAELSRVFKDSETSCVLNFS